jgi:hypothetical protein
VASAQLMEIFCIYVFRKTGQQFSVFVVLSLSGFGMSVILASSNEFASFSSLCI